MLIAFGVRLKQNSNLLKKMHLAVLTILQELIIILSST